MVLCENDGWFHGFDKGVLGILSGFLIAPFMDYYCCTLKMRCWRVESLREDQSMSLYMYVHADLTILELGHLEIIHDKWHLITGS